MALASKFPIIPKGIVGWNYGELWGIMGNYDSTMGNYWELWWFHLVTVKHVHLILLLLVVVFKVLIQLLLLLHHCLLLLRRLCNRKVAALRVLLLLGHPLLPSQMPPSP